MTERWDMDKQHGNGTTGERWGKDSTGGGRGNGQVLMRVEVVDARFMGAGAASLHQS